MYGMNPDKNITYLISLDAIDLNYMSASLNRGNGKVMPIWAKSKLDQRNDKYYEFKIENSDTQDEVNTEMGNILCHICDIDVPAAFLTEHYESFKHKVNVKIINTSLDRIKRCVDHSITDVKKCSKLHFCPVCVTVVNKEEKESHDKSISHKNSLIIEKFLYDFYLLYANENNESKLNGAQIFEEDSKTDLKIKVDEPQVNESEEIVERNMTNNNYLPDYKTNGNIKLTGTQEFKDVVKTVDKVTKGKKEAEVKKSKSDLKEDKGKSDLIRKENENSCKVNPTQSSDTSIVPTKKKKVKLGNVDIHKHEAAMSSGDVEEVLPDAEDLNSSFEETSNVNSKSDVEHYKYIKYIHQLQETIFYLNCKICNINIKKKKSHLESVSHYQNYLKFLEQNTLMNTNSEVNLECIACAEVLNCKDEIEHCMKIKHITNLEIWNKLNRN